MLGEVLAALPANFPAAIVVVQHLQRDRKSVMSDILNRRTPLNVIEARTGDKIAPGQVHIAPPNHHLLVNPDGSLLLTQTELVHFVRPSADLLFESVAASFRERAIAVVLSGAGIDGALGVKAMKKTGGTVIVQQGAQFTGMPDAAEATGVADFIIPVAAIAATLRKLTQEDAA